MTDNSNNRTVTNNPPDVVLSRGDHDKLVVEKLNEFAKLQFTTEELEKEQAWRETVEFDDIDDDDDDEVFLSTPVYRPLQSHVKRRCFSECSDSGIAGRASSDGSTTSSLLEHRVSVIRRDRSRSEPAVPPSVDVESLARELRRVSDEFHSLYTSPRHTPARPWSGQSFFSSAGSRLLENMCDHVLGRSLRPVRRQRSYSESTPSTYRKE